MPNYRYNRSLSLFLRAIALTADLSEACWMDTRVRTAGKKIETERKKDGGRVCNINVLVDIVFPSACTQGSGRRDEEREREERECWTKSKIFEREAAYRSTIDPAALKGENPFSSSVDDECRDLSSPSGRSLSLSLPSSPVSRRCSLLII